MASNGRAQEVIAEAGLHEVIDQANAHQSLVRAAQDMLPVLRERATEAETLRRVPIETINELREAGIFRMLRPARYGGYQLDYGTIQLDVAGELGRACGSTAWVASVVASHDWILGMFPPEAQDDVWGENPDALIVSALSPATASIEREGDGFRLRGRWKFASGCDACAWAILGGAVDAADGGAPEYRWFLLPQSDYAIDDTWFVSGLRGTGSKDIVIEEAFVPEHRSVMTASLRGDGAPGSTHNDCHIFRLPLMAVFPFNLCAPIIGMTRGMIEQFIERQTSRVSRYSNARVADFPMVQYRLSEASAEVDCAELLYRRNAEEINRLGRKGDSIPLMNRVRYRRDLAYAATLCLRAVDRVSAMLGAHGLVEDAPEQRAFRDVHAASQQIALKWDVNGPYYAQVVLGLEPGDSRI